MFSLCCVSPMDPQIVFPISAAVKFRSDVIVKNYLHELSRSFTKATDVQLPFRSALYVSHQNLLITSVTVIMTTSGSN